MRAFDRSFPAAWRGNQLARFSNRLLLKYCMKTWRRKLGHVLFALLRDELRFPRLTQSYRLVSPLPAEVFHQRTNIVTPQPNSNVLITSITTSVRPKTKVEDFNPTSPLRQSSSVVFDRAEPVDPKRFSPESANVIPRSPPRRTWNRLTAREIVDDEFEIRTPPKLISIADLPDDLFSSEAAGVSPRIHNHKDLLDTVELERASELRRVEEEEEENYLSDRVGLSDSSVLIEFLLKEVSDGLDF
jgi:hypothetical protein